MAIDLIKRNQCHNFIIVEKSSSVGGTWHDNKYPGCCCDVWSMLYSYSFEQNPDWTREYPGQEEILVCVPTISFLPWLCLTLLQDYLRNVARKYNLYKYIRFNTSVESATWDDSKNRWKVDVNVTGGKDAEFNPAYSIECDFLVSAVGQLTQPQYPDIEVWASSVTVRVTFITREKKLIKIRCYCCSNYSRDLATNILIDNLPTNSKLGHSTSRWARQRLQTRSTALPSPSSLAHPSQHDGLSRVFL